MCNVVISQESETGGSGDGRPPIIFNPDFFVEKLRHERPEAFTELVLSNITRLIDLPGAEFSQLQGDEEPKTPNGTAAGGFFRSFNFLKRKGQKTLGIVICFSLQWALIRPYASCKFTSGLLSICL